MLGSYLKVLLAGSHEVTTLQRHGADVECDLAAETPRLGGGRYDLVIHAAGSNVESDAMKVNVDGTRRLLEALGQNPPRELVFVSSWEVYSPDAGEGVGEDHQTWALSKAGQSKALAEKEVTEWCAGHGVLPTIVRPARMFGKGIKGEMAAMYGDVAAGRYIHVRDNHARLSLVCASDVAEAIWQLHSTGGIYNVTDGYGAEWIELADAMSANSGKEKRQTFLPARWAAAAWRLAPWLPAVRSSLAPEVLARRSKTLTFSNEKIRAAAPGWRPYRTIDVISRKDPDYPYADNPYADN